MARIRADELTGALEWVLALPGAGRRSGRDAVRQFTRYLVTTGVEWAGWRDGGPSDPAAVVLSVYLPGRTAIVMLPPPGELGIDAAAQVALLRTALEEMAPRRLHFAQALVPPGAGSLREVVTRVGFTWMAPLVYLDRDAVHPWVDPPAGDVGRWISFGPQTYPDFAATLQATYEESLDCPELAGLRPVADIIAAHRASGQFDPQLWQLLRIGEAYAGCLLLARLADGHALEVVYMGVPRSFRGRGIGDVLLRRALAQARDCGAKRLSLAVDDRNVPAKRVYARFGLTPVAQRDAFLYVWR